MDTGQKAKGRQEAGDVDVDLNELGISLPLSMSGAVDNLVGFLNWPDRKSKNRRERNYGRNGRSARCVITDH